MAIMQLRIGALMAILLLAILFLASDLVSAFSFSSPSLVISIPSNAALFLAVNVLILALLASGGFFSSFSTAIVACESNAVAQVPAISFCNDALEDLAAEDESNDQIVVVTTSTSPSPPSLDSHEHTDRNNSSLTLSVIDNPKESVEISCSTDFILSTNYADRELLPAQNICKEIIPHSDLPDSQPASPRSPRKKKKKISKSSSLKKSSAPDMTVTMVDVNRLEDCSLEDFNQAISAIIRLRRQEWQLR